MVASRPILERGSAEVLIGKRAIVFEVGEEMNDNLVGRSSLRFFVAIFALEQ